MSHMLSEGKREEYIKRVNFYRVKMAEKLYRLAQKKDDKKFEKLSKIISLHSKAFRVWLMEEVKAD